MTTITPPAAVPAYDGVLPYPDYPLPYEGSDLVKVTGSKFQYTDELISGQAKIREALAILRPAADEPVHPVRTDPINSWRVISAADEGRRLISPYMNHDPSTPGFVRNEVPRYVDGVIHPDDAVNPLMNRSGSVQMHQQTILHRLPRADVQGLNWQSVQASLETSTSIDDLLIWGNRVTESGAPDLPRAIAELETLDAQFTAMLQNQGAAPVERSGLMRKLSALPTGVKIAGGAALAVAVVGTGIAIAKD